MSRDYIDDLFDEDKKEVELSQSEVYFEWWLEEISDFIPETIEKSIQAIAQLQADKAELLEALKKLRNHYGLFPENRMEIESLIKKHKNDKRGNITED